MPAACFCITKMQGTCSSECDWLQVLFDPRRNSCHSLVLNYFVAGGGMTTLAQQFAALQRLLWDEWELKERRDKEKPANSESGKWGLPF